MEIHLISSRKVFLLDFQFAIGIILLEKND